MEPRDPLIQQIVALLNRPLNADLLDRPGIVLKAHEPALKACWKGGSCGQIGHSIHGRQTRDWHDASDDGNLDARQPAPITPIEEPAVVCEQLCGDPIGSGINLGLEVSHVHQLVGCLRVPLRKPSHADTERRVRVLVIKSGNVPHQVDGMWEGAGAFILRHRVRTISAKRQQVSHLVRGVAIQNDIQLVGCVSNTGGMRDWIEMASIRETHHKIMGPSPGASTGPIRHGDERGPQIGKLVKTGLERLRRRRGLWREELETDGAAISRHDLTDVHAAMVRIPFLP